MFNVVTILISQTWEIFDYSVTRLDAFETFWEQSYVDTLQKHPKYLASFLGYCEEQYFLC